MRAIIVVFLVPMAASTDHESNSRIATLLASPACDSEMQREFGRRWRQVVEARRGCRCQLSEHEEGFRLCSWGAIL